MFKIIYMVREDTHLNFLQYWGIPISPEVLVNIILEPSNIKNVANCQIENDYSLKGCLYCIIENVSFTHCGLGLMKYLVASRFQGKVLVQDILVGVSIHMHGIRHRGCCVIPLRAVAKTWEKSNPLMQRWSQWWWDSDTKLWGIQNNDKTFYIVPWWEASAENCKNKQLDNLVTQAPMTSIRRSYAQYPTYPKSRTHFFRVEQSSSTRVQCEFPIGSCGWTDQGVPPLSRI